MGLGAGGVGRALRLNHTRETRDESVFLAESSRAAKKRAPWGALDEQYHKSTGSPQEPVHTLADPFAVAETLDGVCDVGHGHDLSGIARDCTAMGAARAPMTAAIKRRVSTTRCC